MKRAIALCGGGTRGSYEIGVWKALRELKIDYHIVTGTSIGAINGAMFVQGDYEKANELWEDLTISRIIKTELKIDDWFKSLYEQKDNVIDLVKGYIKNRGADIKPLMDLLDSVIDEDKIMNSDIEFGITTVSIPTGKSLELSKKDIGKEDLKKYLLASSACFPAFPICKIGDEHFIDGRFHDDLPIDFAFKLGADEVIAVDLNSYITHEEHVSNPKVKYIKASQSLGPFFDFDKKLIYRNKTLGYNDAMKKFGVFCGKKYSFICKTIQKEKYYNNRVKFMRLFRELLSKSNKLNKNKLLESLNIKYRGNSFPDSNTLFYNYLLSFETCATILEIDDLPSYNFEEFLTRLLSDYIEIDKYNLFVENILRKLCNNDDSNENNFDTILNRKYMVGHLLSALLKSGKIDSYFISIANVLPHEAIAAISLWSIYDK